MRQKPVSLLRESGSLNGEADYRAAASAGLG